MPHVGLLNGRQDRWQINQEVILRHVRQMQRQDGVEVSTRDRLRHVTTDIAGRDHKLLVPEPRHAAHDAISDGHAKTRIAQLTDGGEGVDFLGFHHRLVHSRSRQRNGQSPSSPDALRVRRCSTPGTAASLGNPGVLRAVIGTAAYLTGIAVLGLAIGTLLRATAAAISTLVALVLLLPGLGALLLPASWKDNVLQYLPTNAGSSFTDVQTSAGQLSTGAGAAVFAAWVLIPLAFAAMALKRRSA